MVWNGNIIFFGVKDLKSVDSFYRKELELSLYKDQGLCKIYSIPGGGKIGFCTHMEKNIANKSPIITLLTDDVDEVYQRLKGSQCEVLKPPKYNHDFNIYINCKKY